MKDLSIVKGRLSGVLKRTLILAFILIYLLVASALAEEKKGNGSAPDKSAGNQQVIQTTVQTTSDTSGQSLNTAPTSLKDVILSKEEMDKIIKVLSKLYSDKGYRYKVAKLASKYKDIKIVTNFDSFFTDLKDSMKKYEKVITSEGFKTDVFYLELEALYKALIVSQIDEQWNDPGFQKKLQKLQEALNDPQFPKNKKKYVKEALDKLNSLKRAVDVMRGELNPTTLENVKKNLSELKAELKFQR